MLGDISGLEKIYIVCGYTDMRKSIDGLCAIIEDQLKMDPSSSALFLFCGRRRDRIKALFREPDGFVLIYKRLSVRGGYQWPRKQSEVRDRYRPAQSTPGRVRIHPDPAQRKTKVFRRSNTFPECFSFRKTPVSGIMMLSDPRRGTLPVQKISSCES